MTDMILVEPSDGEFVRTGDKWPFTFWHRDDETARDIDGDPTDPADPAAHWWDCSEEDGGEGPATWEYVSAQPDLRLVEFANPWRCSAKDTTEATDGN